MAWRRGRQRQRVRFTLGGVFLSGALSAPHSCGFTAVPARRTGTSAPAARQPSVGSTNAAPAVGARRRLRRSRRGHTARRIFDTGSFFGVGVPEAAVIALLGWFLLGPEELFRLAKQAGNWLGELRTFVGQAAQQYESALDDDSTRKAIEGIRQTQRTVSEISESWRSVTDSFRNPLALGSTLESAYTKYSSDRKSKAEAASDDSQDQPNETAEELERKRENSKLAAADLWYKGPDAEQNSNWSPQRAKEYTQRLDERLGELDRLTLQLQELREGIMEDRQGLQALLQAPPAQEASNSKQASAKADVPELEKARTDSVVEVK